MVTIYLKWGNKLVCGHAILFSPCMSCALYKSPHSKKWRKLHLHQWLYMWTLLLLNIFRVNSKAPAVLSLSSLSVLVSLSVVFAVAEGVGSLPGIGALPVRVSSVPIFAVLMVARWVMSVRAVAVSAAVVLLWLLYPLNICKHNSIQCYTAEMWHYPYTIKAAVATGLFFVLWRKSTRN